MADPSSATLIAGLGRTKMNGTFIGFFCFACSISDRDSQNIAMFPGTDLVTEMLEMQTL
jgi:hypothetical protein